MTNSEMKLALEIIYSKVEKSYRDLHKIERKLDDIYHELRKLGVGK